MLEEQPPPAFDASSDLCHENGGRRERESPRLDNRLATPLARFPRGGGVAEAALWYAAEMRWPICPCGVGGKEPLTEHGFHDASLNPKDVEQWWKRWPQANLALATGAASGVLLLDVDPRHGGHESLAQLIIQHGDEWLDTCEGVSGGNGRHFCFSVRSGLLAPSRSSVANLGGVEVKAEGRYAILTPSRH